MTTPMPADKTHSPATSSPTPKKPRTWMKVLLGIVVAAVAIVGLFAVVVAMQPSEFRVQRSRAMAAPPEAVFEQINDFRNWQAWSPWAELDPDAKYTFEGPPAGAGAVFAWSGNDQVGEGWMKITESRPPERIRYELTFVRPMPDTADTVFTFTPAAEGTQVTWTMTGENNFLAKAICLFVDFDKLLGGDFEKGLENIKAIVEAEASPLGDAPQPSDDSDTPNSHENS
jgi:uncharacterized protein YndB with AHSA1/START domain